MTKTEKNVAEFGLNVFFHIYDNFYEFIGP